MSLTIHDILAQFREEQLYNRHLGDRFERLICRYLELDPLFADRFSNVWMWNEWPQKGATGDIGIDIVAEERATGEFCGIQCKFYLPDQTLSKNDIDSFLNALGDKRFTSGIIVSTTDKWGSNAEKSLQNRDKPVNRLRVQDLDDSPVDWSRFSLKNPQALSLRTKKKLRPHQTAAGLKADKTRIHYNSHLTLDGIPLEAYDYIVNGKPALEWIMERYQITIDKASGIKNDPNDWCREHDNPRYIVDLLKRVTRVSLETIRIVNALPALNERQAQ
ncbi:MAG: restriction endonuclease [Akkermansiaceae bacterium]|jgi:predicted helicase|nr:restriction endonuclease [Akkermansiaceae bacterium]